MSKKSKEDAIDELEEVEPTEEQKEEAESLAESKAGNKSGSVVTKHQLCGRYCSGCPHGPYAWLVNDEGWHYLGKVGGETNNSTEATDSEANTNVSDSYRPDSIEDLEKVTPRELVDGEIVEGDPVMINGYVARPTGFRKDGDKQYVQLEYEDHQLTDGYKPHEVRVDVRNNQLVGQSHGAHPQSTEADLTVKRVPDDYPEIDWERNEHTGSGERNGRISILNPKTGEYREQVEIESPYDAKDDIKDLDWDDTHREWDRNRGAWTVDLGSVDDVVDELQEKYDVSVRSDVEYWAAKQSE